jgi:hypothetical protein
MEVNYIVMVYRRERVERPSDERQGDERISGMVESIKRDLRNPSHTAEELWQLLSGCKGEDEYWTSPASIRHLAPECHTVLKTQA